MRSSTLGWIALPVVLLACLDRPFSLNLNHPNEKPPQRQALIVLSDPQIYSRETLVDDRREEIEYLRTLLEGSKTVEFEPQIRRQMSVVTALAGELGIKFDPVAGGAVAGAADLAQLEQQIQVTRLQAELLGAQRQLDAVRAGGEAAAAPDTPGEAPTFSGPNPEALQKINERVNALSGKLDSALEKMATETRKAQTTASPTELFRDRQAYRSELRAALDEVNLDDVHDAAGNSLYRLQFRATVFPGKKKDKFGVARLTVRRPALDWDDIDRLYKALLGHVTFRVNRGAAEDDLSYTAVGASGLFNLTFLSFARDGRDRSLCQGRKAAENRDRCGGIWLAVPSEMTNDLEGFLEPESVAKKRKPREVTDIARLYKERELLHDKLGSGIIWGAADDAADLQDYSDLKLADYCAAVNEDAWLQERSDALNAAAEGWAQRVDLQDAEEAKLLEGVKKTLDRTVYRNVRPRFPFPSWNEIDKQLEWCGAELEKRPSSKPQGDYEKDLEAALLELKKSGDASKDPDKPLEWAEVGAVSRARVRPWTFAERVSELWRNDDLPEKWEPRRTCGETRVYGARPHEQSQRISTVASAADAVQLAAALSAVVPGQGVGADLGIGSLQKAVGQAEAIERQPIIVGFAERVPEPSLEGRPGGRDATRCQEPSGSTLAQVGWAFGPKAQIEHHGRGSDLRLRHIVANYPVTADVSVPGWWPYIDLELDSGWVANWHDDCCDGGTDVLATSIDSRRRRQELRVNLPVNRADLDGLLNYVSRPSLGRVVRQIRVDQVIPERLQVCTGSRTVLVYGRDVWRSTEAFLAGNRQTAIQVLPDMEGVALTFDTNALPLPLPSENVNLSISTRSGSVTRPITIKGAAGKKSCSS